MAKAKKPSQTGIDTRFKNKIINALRRLTYTWPPRNQAKNKRKIDKALYSCELCQNYCYEGTSQQTYLIYETKYGKMNPVLWKKGDMDHKDPVIDPKTGFVDWNTVVIRLYVPLSGWQYICKPCHVIKTNDENQSRRKKK